MGWSETLMMECSGNTLDGIYKLNTDKPDNSEQLLTFRSDGNWLGLGCSWTSRDCKQGDHSVVMVWTNSENMKTKTVYDFRFLEYTSTIYKHDGGIDFQTSDKCVRR